MHGMQHTRVYGSRFHSGEQSMGRPEKARTCTPPQLELPGDKRIIALSICASYRRWTALKSDDPNPPIELAET